MMLYVAETVGDLNTGKLYLLRRSLQDVLETTLPNQTLPSEPLHLTPVEKAALMAFLKSLTDAHKKGAQL